MSYKFLGDRFHFYHERKIPVVIALTGDIPKVGTIDFVGIDFIGLKLTGKGGIHPMDNLTNPYIEIPIGQILYINQLLEPTPQEAKTWEEMP